MGGQAGFCVALSLPKVTRPDQPNAIQVANLDLLDLDMLKFGS